MADKSQGAITLLRDIQKHWIWRQSRPFSRGQAWIDMLLSANHKAENLLFEGKIIRVERGEFVTSQFKLAERWGWSRQQVRTFLKLLEDPDPDRSMVICQNLTNKATKITILNYNDLQKLTTKTATNQQPTSNQPATINKNDKNDKNIYIYFDHKDYSWHNITDQDIADWRKAYPACNIEIELSIMRVWIKSARAKGHKKNWRRFITNWLSRQQDRGGTKTGSPILPKPMPRPTTKEDQTKNQIDFYCKDCSNYEPQHLDNRGAKRGYCPILKLYLPPFTNGADCKDKKPKEGKP